jgi:prephenate dehydrogenase
LPKPGKRIKEMVLQQGIKTLVVVGVGLIGGSFALSLKRAGKVEHVIGVGRSLENLQRALELGVVDEISQDVAAVVSRADLVLLATPVGQMAALLQAMAPHLSPLTIISDAGSTKGDVVEVFRHCVPHHLARCVPAHPIAGSELSGAAAAQYGLYENRNVVLTPLAESDVDAVECMADLWQSCGARIQRLTPAEHDAIFATVSHLPHLLAFSYVNMIAGKDNAERCLDFASTGFRDFTRIAGSSPEMWRDICLANRAALLQELASYRAELDALALQIEAGESDTLSQRFAAARQVRGAWHQKFQRKG